MELIAKARNFEGITGRITFVRSMKYRCMEWKDLSDGGSFIPPIRPQDVADANRLRLKSSTATAFVLFYTWGVGIAIAWFVHEGGLISLVWSSFETS